MKENPGNFTKERRFADQKDISFRNETNIISWIHRWGFSSVKILNFILGLNQTSTISTIEKHEKIVREKTYVNGLHHVYHLTATGLMIAESRTDDDFEYPEIFKEKVVTSHFFHDLYTQALTAIAVKRSVCAEFATPRMAGNSGKEDKKIPDVIWASESNSMIAIEVELNQKVDKKLDNFMGMIIESIESGSIAECLIVTPSKATLKNYTKQLDRKIIPIWTRKSGGVWRLEREVTVRKVATARISIVLVPEEDMDKTLRRLEVSGDMELWLAERSGSKNSSLD